MGVTGEIPTSHLRFAHQLISIINTNKIQTESKNQIIQCVRIVSSSTFMWYSFYNFKVCNCKDTHTNKVTTTQLS